MAEPAKKERKLQAEIDKYTKALASDPDSRLFAALADALRRAGQVKAAVEIASKGVEKHPAYMSGMVVLGQALQEEGQADRALELFQKVVRMNPQNITAQRAIAELSNKLGDHHAAFQAYRVLVVLDPTDARAKEQLEILEATAPRGQKPITEPPQTPVKDSEPGPEPDDDKTQEISYPQTPQDIANEGPQAEQPVGEGSMTVDLSVSQARPEIKTDETPFPPDAQDDGFFIPPETSPEVTQAPPADPASADESAQGSEKDTLPMPERNAQEASAPSETTAPEAKPDPAPASGPAAPSAQPKKLTDEEKLDLFFGGMDPKNIGAGNGADGFVIKAAAEALPDQAASPNKPPEKPTPENVEITSSAMGRLYWNQGFRRKALAVLAEQVRERENDTTLKREFIAACTAMGLKPGEVLLRASVDALTDNKQAREKSLTDDFFDGDKVNDVPAPEQADADEDSMNHDAAEPQPGPGHEPEPDPEPGASPAPGQEPAETQGPDNGPVQPVARDKLDKLRSYLKKIKGEKGE